MLICAGGSKTLICQLMILAWAFTTDYVRTRLSEASDNNGCT
jgi:hypothetical protein